MSRVRLCSLPADKMEAEAVATLLFQDQRPLRGPQALLDWRLDSRVTRMLQQRAVEGRPGEHLAVGNNGKLRADWALFFGSGARSDFEDEQAGPILQDILCTCRKAGFQSVGICLESDSANSRETYRDILERLIMDLRLEPLTCQLSCAEEQARLGMW